MQKKCGKMTRRVEEWLSNQFKRINEGLPKSRLPLSELLSMQEPSVETIGGGRHHFLRDELQELLNVLPEELWRRVRLPLVFRRSLESSESVYYLEGGEAEAEAVKILAGVRFLPENKGRYFTYKPILSILVSKYPTIIVIGVS